MTKNYVLRKALEHVREAAMQKIESHNKALADLQGCSGKTVEIWRKIHQREIDKAQYVEEWCFDRLMDNDENQLKY